MNVIFGLATLFFVSFLLWNYFFSIYETKTFLNPRKEIFYVGDTLEINVLPLNAFGKRIPFRKIRPNIKILESQEIANFEVKDDNRFLLIAEKEGSLALEISNRFSLQNELIKITINKQP